MIRISNFVIRVYFGGSFAFNHGIIFRSFLPTTSTGCELSCSYGRLKFFILPSYFMRGSQGYSCFCFRFRAFPSTRLVIWVMGGEGWPSSSMEAKSV